jgi:hypothetical protein
MTLRNPLTRDVLLPDGRVVHVRVGVAEDSYIAARELDTVTLEISNDREHLAGLTTVLDVDQVDEAHALLREVAEALESGAAAPTAGALEPFADRLRQ